MKHLFLNLILLVISTLSYGQDFENYKTLNGHSAGIHNIRFSPDGKILASCGYDNTAILWDVASGTKIKTLRGHVGGIIEVSFSPDGTKVATASEDGTAKVWSVKTGNLIGNYPCQPYYLKTKRGRLVKRKGVSFVAFSPDNKSIWFAGESSYIMKGNVLDPRQKPDTVAFLGVHGRYVAMITGGCISPDGKDILVSYNKSVLGFDMKTGKLKKRFIYSQFADVNDVVVGPNANQITAWCYTGDVVTWNYQTNERIKKIRVTNPNNYSCATFSPNKKYLVTGAYGNKARVWDWEKSQEVDQLEGHKGIVRTSRFNPTKMIIATASSDKSIKLWKEKEEKFWDEPQEDPQKDTPQETPVNEPITKVVDNNTKLLDNVIEEDDLVVGKKFNLKSIQFERGKDVFLDKAYPQLKNLFQIMKEHQKVEILLEGHTDNTGSRYLNWTLSKKRVVAVRKYLVDKGISGRRIRIKPYGPDKPIAPNNTEENKSKNRRVEVIILKV